MKNITAFSAKEYDKKIKQTLPYHEEFYRQITDVVKYRFNNKVSWLDVGCGTGKMSKLGLELSNKFVLLDNNSDMLDIARSQTNSDNAEFILKSSSDMEYTNAFDVVTAVQTFHYLSADERRKAIGKCYNALKSSGIFITFENFAPDTKIGTKLYLNRWKQYQISQGKTEQESQEHISRYGNDYFPITIDEHKKLLKDCGFKVVELLWCSYMQAGLMGVK